MSRTFAVSPPPSIVLGYLKDFANAEEWDPGTQTCTRTDDGPVDVGAEWHNVSKIFGVTAELTYTLTKATDSELVFVGENKSSRSTDTITVDSAGGGASVKYRADLEMKGAAKVLDPVMKLVFEKLANDVQKRLSSVLNALPVG